MTDHIQTYRSGPIVALRLALNPVVLKADGTEELLGEIAAKLLDIPGDLAFLQRVTVQAAGLWKSGEGVSWKGPPFKPPGCGSQAKASPGRVRPLTWCEGKACSAWSGIRNDRR